MKGILSEIGRLNHIAIAVPNIQKASSIWENALGANISSTQSLPEHGVKVVFIESPNTKVELLEPLNKQSPITKFLENIREDKPFLIYGEKPKWWNASYVL